MSTSFGPGITKHAIRSFYDRLSPHFRELWGPHLHDGLYPTGRESKEEAQVELVRHLVRDAEVPRGAHVLDVGCGMGATSVFLARELDCEVTGITLSPIQAGIARTLARTAGVSSNFLEMDAEEITLEERFDVLWMVGVLGHLSDQQVFVDASPRLLKAGGRFVLGDWMVADGLNAAEREKYVEPVRKGMLMPAIHSPQETASWFEDAGYRVIRTRDLSRETLRTWDVGVSIVQAPALVKLALELGRDAVDLLRAIRGMRSAMRSGRIVYGELIAERA